jgi:hypothetical protein
MLKRTAGRIMGDVVQLMAEDGSPASPFAEFIVIAR